MHLREGVRAGRLVLDGHLVLLAEDSCGAPSLTELHLCAAGAGVLVASTAYQALLLASRHPLTAAVLDLQLGVHAITQINAYLAARLVPLLMVASSVPSEGAHAVPAPILDKVVAGPDLARALAALTRPSPRRRRQGA